MQSRAMEPLAVGIGEAAGILGVSVWSVKEWVKAGKLRVIRIGRGKKRSHVRIPISEIRRILEGRQR